jgi:tRNA 2-thiouridine synthesizing protein E
MFTILSDNGFLKDHTLWAAAIAKFFAKEEGILLNCIHWKIIWVLRGYFEIKNTIPNNRLLVNILKNYYPNILNSDLVLYRLFPTSPILQAARIAGLPEHSTFS